MVKGLAIPQPALALAVLALFFDGVFAMVKGGEKREEDVDGENPVSDMRSRAQASA